MDLPELPDFHSPDDLLNDRRFRKWARGESPGDAAHWQRWLAAHPEKVSLYEKAVAAMLVIRGTEMPEEAEDESGQERIQAAIATEAQQKTFNWWNLTSWAAAAAIALVAGFWLVRPAKQTVSWKPAQQQHAGSVQWILVSNRAKAAKLINLPDGSSVLLSKGSSLTYQQQMTGARREVHLNGEGFFEVVKNPEKPFFVYAGKVVTKVLGTSFRIRSFEGQPTAVVAVKTGKVAVSTTGTWDDDAAPAHTLLPDQQLNLVLNGSGPQAALPAPVAIRTSPPIQQEQFDFQFTPIAQAFAVLEANYGVKVHYDRQKMRNCTLTASLKDEPFLEKIRLICLATESTFEVDDEHVYISSAGCP